MAIITMSRQIGSRASELANRLCAELGLVAFDKNLMAQVASNVGLGQQEIIDYSEDEYEKRGFFEALFRRRRELGEVSMWVDSQTRTVRQLDEQDAIGLIRSTMNAAYKRGEVLIVGRGGQAILENRPGVLHLRVVAPFEERVLQLQASENLTAAQARRLIEERDDATREYLRMFHHIDVDDATLYHMVLNTGKLSVGQCVDLVKQAVQALP
ncbi:MAG: AAA family ATPase [Anaerolineae bacterium]